MVKLFFKLCLFTYILYLTPFFKELPRFLGFDLSNITSSLYTYDLKQTTSLKDALNLMYVHEDIYIQNKQNVEEIISYDENTIKNQKKVYIYNTHQQETYMDEKGVVEAAIILANELQSAGVQVVYESNDFKQWLKENNYDYNYSYYASNFYLNEAMIQHSGFDLVIDFHRDAIPRESSYIVKDGISYAKMMFVVGGLSKNAEKISNLSNTLKSIVDTNIEGIMKNTMTREAYYNQSVYENMVLIEVGSDHNTFEEVKNSTKLLADAILQYLRGD